MGAALKASDQNGGERSGRGSRGDPRMNLKFTVTEQEMGGADSLRRAILTFVVQEHYQRAIDELRIFGDSKKDYPQFKERAERYINYAIDLVNAIKAKKSFPGLQALGMSKQQELYERAVDHFADLKATLRKVESIEREVKLEDVRSTVWVVKAVVMSLFAILVLAFVLEVSRGVIPTTAIVIEDFFGDITNFIFDKLGI